jgi:hypothetical protein
MGRISIGVIACLRHVYQGGKLHPLRKIVFIRLSYKQIYLHASYDYMGEAIRRNYREEEP